MTTVQLHDLRFEPFISEQELGRAIDVVAVGINAKYAGMRPLFIGVLNGSFFFASELLKRITIECEITFVKVASYHGTTSTGQVHQLIGLNERIHGRHVVVLEDIVDTGLTLQYLLQALKLRHPASLKICTLLSKPARRKAEVDVDYCGFTIDDHFVIGYGLDYANHYRQLPYIGVIRPEFVK